MSGRVGPLKPLTPPFINTYSMDFDGVGDYVATSGVYSELDGQTKMTFSAWIKPTTAATTVIASIEDNGSTEQFRVVFHSSRYILIRTYTGSGRDTRTANSSIDLNVWTHITFCLDFSLSLGTRGKIFINGVDATSTDAMNQASLNTSGGALRIGARNVGTLLPFPGLIDEVAIWSGTDQRANISDIYSVDGAVDLSLLSTPPTNWYRMGDNGSYKSPQWLIPNNENKDKVSNYSFDFDGVDDKIELGTQSLGITGAISVSAWVKIPISGTWGSPYLEVIFAEDSSVSRNFNLYFRPPPFFNTFNFDVYHTNGTKTSLISTGITPNDNQWHNLLATFDGTTNTNSVKLYVDGVLNVQATAVSTGVQSIPAVIPTIGSLSNGNNWFFEGNIDEVSIFDSAINISDVWNGSGQPIDVSSVSGIVSYYKMGEEATFSGGVWTVPDQVGSNDGTSNAMTIENRVGSAPSSSNNAVSFNMDLIDRVEDTPPTP